MSDEARTQPAAAGAVPVGRGPGVRPTVVVADDDEAVRALLRALCEDMGCDVIEAADGLLAVEVSVRTQPDLILMDARMPRMDGFEATRRLRNAPSTTATPILILTGLRSREDRLAGFAAGASDFLNKPVDAEELLLRVRNSLKIKEYQDFLADHARILERRVAERTRELREAFERLGKADTAIRASYLSTIQRLAAVSEFRDEDTGQHVRRIGHYTRILADGMGLAPDFCEALSHASILHDIGKVAIPDAILLKRGSLSPQEWEIMKSHTVVGARILAGSESEYLRMGEEIAISHHERWDGSGYPAGNSGHAIPLSARLTQLADTYDALRSARPYKPAFDHDAACRTMLHGDGRTLPQHFDPQALQEFARLAGRFGDVYAEHADG
jgi:putative two-component system response regulator